MRRKCEVNGETRVLYNESLPELVCALEADGLFVVPLALQLLPVALLLVDHLLHQAVQQRLGLLRKVHAHGVVDVHLRDLGPDQVVPLLLPALHCWQSLRAPDLALLLVEGDHRLREGVLDRPVVDLRDPGRPGKARDGVVDFDDDVVAVVVHGLNEGRQPTLSDAALLSVGQVAALHLSSLQVEQLHLELALLLVEGIVEHCRRVDWLRQRLLLPDGLEGELETVGQH